MMLGTQATPEEIALERRRLGLDRPLPVRYAVWLADVAHLNLGRSQANNRPVASLIADAFPYTLRLALAALALAVLIGFPLGILAALNQNRFADTAITAFNSLG